MHPVEYTYSFLKDGRARAGAEAEERANRSLKCSELALAVHEKIRYIEEGNYTKEEWKYLHEEISQLTSSIWMSTYTIIRKEEAEKMIDLFPFVSLGKWIGGIMLIGFLIGYFMRRYGSIFAFLIGFVISIYRSIYQLALRMTIPMEITFLLVLVFGICIWAGFGPGFIGYGASVLGRRIREGEKPFLNEKELIGIVTISIFAIWLVLMEIVLPPYYLPRLYPQFYSYAHYGTYLIMIPLTAFLYGIWSKERHGIMSFMVAYFPLFVMGCSWLEMSCLCFPIGTMFGLAGLAGWFVSKFRNAKKA